MTTINRAAVEQYFAQFNVPAHTMRFGPNYVDIQMARALTTWRRLFRNTFQWDANNFQMANDQYVISFHGLDAHRVRPDEWSTYTIEVQPR